MSWPDRMRWYFLNHPRTNAAAIVGFAVAVPALDTPRLIDAHTEAHVSWRAALGVGVAVGLIGLGMLVALYLSLRSIGQDAVRWGGIVGGVLLVLLFGATHPRYGPDSIGDGGTYLMVVAVDTCYLLGLCALSVIVWRRPIPDFEARANSRPRHGPRWKRRSAARRRGRPGGR